MTNQEFVKFCYLNLLKRNPDNIGLKNYTNALNNFKLTKEEVFAYFLNCEEYKLLIANEFVPAGHFYSALPSLDERNAYLSNEKKWSNEIEGVNLNSENQIELLKIFKQYHDECPFPDNKTEKYRYYFLNPSYSFTDALVLYSMMRNHNPKNIIEIGSGFSSSVMLDTNDLYFNGNINFTFIEPYPQLLRSLLRESDAKHKIYPNKLQDIDLSVFTSLKENDILFIDSTHVSKLNSDVNMIFFEILPLLKKGVIIHFHDIFYPFEYPKQWIQEGRTWNEAYMLHCFLQYNNSFEVHFFGNYLHKIEHTWIKANMPKYLNNSGGNIWLRKIK